MREGWERKERNKKKTAKRKERKMKEKEKKTVEHKAWSVHFTTEQVLKEKNNGWVILKHLLPFLKHLLPFQFPFIFWHCKKHNFISSKLKESFLGNVFQRISTSKTLIKTIALNYIISYMVQKCAFLKLFSIFQKHFCQMHTFFWNIWSHF